MIAVDKQQPKMKNTESVPQITREGEHIDATRAKSSAAVPCGMPKWLTRITGQQQNNYSTMTSSQARSLGSSFADPGLIGVGCTPPRSNHFIIVGSSDGKATTMIVENSNIQGNDSDIQRKSSSSTILLHKGGLGISYSASNSPIARRRDTSALAGSGKRTWSGSGANNLNFLDAVSPSADSDFYNLLIGRTSSNVKENTTYENEIYDERHIPCRGDQVVYDGVKSSRLIREHEFADVKDLKEKIEKVIPKGSEFPVATKESLDGLTKESLKETDDNLFDMDEHPTTSLDDQKQILASGVGATYRQEHDGTEETSTMTLTQKILEKGMPQNWFFQSNEMAERGNKDVISGRNYVNGKKHKNIGKHLNPNQMRELNAWAPQNL